MTTTPEHDELTEQTDPDATPAATVELNDAHDITEDDPEPPDTFPTDAS
jgi:hypothetical protein